MNQNNNNYNYSDDVKSNQASWTAGNLFYLHLSNVWEGERVATENATNTSLDAQSRLDKYETLYNMLLIRSYMIEPLILNTEMYKHIQELKEKLEKDTGHAEFANLYDQPEKLKEIKINLQKLNALLWKAQYASGMMMQIKERIKEGTEFA